MSKQLLVLADETRQLRGQVVHHRCRLLQAPVGRRPCRSVPPRPSPTRPWEGDAGIAQPVEQAADVHAQGVVHAVIRSGDEATRDIDMYSTILPIQRAPFRTRYRRCITAVPAMP